MIANGFSLNPRFANRGSAISSFLVAASLCLLGMAQASADTLAGAVAQLGTTRMTAPELAGFVNSLAPNVRQQALADPQLMDRLVQLEIIRRTVLNEAKAKKWQQRPEVVQQADAARDAIVLKSYLASVAALPDNYPSEQDVRTAYDLNRDSFMVPRQYRLQQIFIASLQGDKNAAAVQRTAQDLAQKAHSKSVKFDDLARANSQHKPSASNGGDMGWALETQILPEVRVKIAGMSLGDVSNPIRSPAGWHIIRLVDTKPAAPRPLAEVRAVIVASLRQRKLQEQEQHYIVQMMQKTPAKLDEAQLRKAFEAAR